MIQVKILWKFHKYVGLDLWVKRVINKLVLYHFAYLGPNAKDTLIRSEKLKIFERIHNSLQAAASEKKCFRNNRNIVQICRLYVVKIANE